MGWQPIDEFLLSQDRRRGRLPRPELENRPEWRAALEDRLAHPGSRPDETDEEESHDRTAD